jgi:hypothetical protein
VYRKIEIEDGVLDEVGNILILTNANLLPRLIAKINSVTAKYLKTQGRSKTCGEEKLEACGRTVHSGGFFKRGEPATWIIENHSPTSSFLLHSPTRPLVLLLLPHLLAKVVAVSVRPPLR